MVACIPITQEEIRAELWMGDTLLAKTPFIKTFNVTQSRQQLTGNCSISFEMVAGTQFVPGQQIKIKAGVKGNLRYIFTGEVDEIKAEPVWGKPSYFSISLTSKGVLSQLENKTFSRRMKSDGRGMFCLITGGSLNRPNSYTTLGINKSSGNQTAIAFGPSPATTGNGEQSQLTVYNPEAANSAAGGIAQRIARQEGQAGATTGEGTGGLVNHTHEDLDNGGPAFGVYAAD